MEEQGGAKLGPGREDEEGEEEEEEEDEEEEGGRWRRRQNRCQKLGASETLTT